MPLPPPLLQLRNLGGTIVLLPTYIERENIQRIVREIFSLEPDICIVVIDDNSPDRTAEAVQAMMAQYARLSLIVRPRKEGLGEAYKAAFAAVLAHKQVRSIVTMDADGSHAAAELGKLRNAAIGADLVIGSRYVRDGGIENWEHWRLLLSRCGNYYARTVTGLPIKDMTSGFMHISADALRRLDFTRMHASGYAFLMELKYALSRQRSSVTEVPITFRSRREGESKISRHIIREGLATPWLIRFRRRG